MSTTVKKFVITDVPIEVVMHVARTINISPFPLSKDSLRKSLEQICGDSYLQRGLTTAEQLNLIKSTPDKKYAGNEEFKEDFKRAHISDFPIIARKALQRYPPFLSYINNIHSGYEADEAAVITAGVFDLKSEISTRFFRSSGLFCGILIQKDKAISLESSSLDDPDYIKKLRDSLRTEFEAQNLISLLLSTEVVDYFSKKSVDFTRPAKALVEISSDPKTSLYKIFEFVESCLFLLGADHGVNVKNAKGLGQIAQEFRTAKVILSNPTSLGVGLGSLRNMTNHGPDTETGKAWNFSAESALGASLLAIRYIRSIFLFCQEKRQEL